MLASVRMLGTAALAATLSLGVAAPAAVAGDGHHGGYGGYAGRHGDHHSGWDRDGDHRGWNDDNDGSWRWGGWRDRHDSHRWDRAGHQWRDRSDRDPAGFGKVHVRDRSGRHHVVTPVSTQASFARHQQALLSALGRADACLAVLADRMDERADTIAAYRAKIADLIAQVRAATSESDLRAIVAPWFG